MPFVDLSEDEELSVPIGSPEWAERERRSRAERMAAAPERPEVDEYMQAPEARQALAELAGRGPTPEDEARRPVPLDEVRERIGAVEARLRSGDAAGVEADVAAGRDAAQVRPAVGARVPPSPAVTPTASAAAAPDTARAQTPPAPAPVAPARAGGLGELARQRPTGNPVAAAMGAASQRGADRSVDQQIARWDARIHQLEELQRNTRDDRQRAVIGSLITNLVMGAAYALAGARPPASMTRAHTDAIDRRAGERMGDLSREWDRTDEMILRAQQLGTEREGQRADAARDEQQAAARSGLAERRLSLSERQYEDQSARGRAELEQTTAERELARRPESPISQAAQADWQTRIATYRSLGHGALADRLEEIVPRDRLREYSAEQLERITGGLPTPHMRGSAARGGGGGRRGGTAPAAPWSPESGATIPREAWGTAEDPIVRDAMEFLGMTEGTARSAAAEQTSRRGLIRQLGTAGRSDELQEQTTRIPGYRRPEGARRLSVQESRVAATIATADAEFRSAVTRLERQLSQLTAAERAAGVGGLGSERYSEIQHALDVVRNQLRQINNSGNSLGAQQMAEHSIPGLTERTTADAILANVRAAQRVKHDYVTAYLGTMGYEPEGGGGHGGGGGQAQAPSGGSRFRVSREGQSSERELSAEQAQQLRDRGFTVEGL